ncbi:heavy-metal-associated domain-containing protein [Thermosipho atlanticus]|uniref:Copper chaperone CopZ n=1 Tax=Thermosipho atlanticus DSM 15807 TaxID=1123380 RepID=A0A1M5QUG9_9BACT|nr:heavy-metal-associated domain-containing protein [Thermosipho atlanticus]SHH17794.1 Copper chaperone CopZ [Thermosipho atlanticus DSM 15807]
MKKVVIIKGMTCEHCVMHVKKELEKLSGVDFLSVEIGKAVLEGKNLDEDLIRKAVNEAGYEVVEIIDDGSNEVPHSKEHHHEKHHGGHSKHNKGCCH